MVAFLSSGLLLAAALAAPHRAPSIRPMTLLDAHPERSSVVVVKLAEGQGLVFEAGQLNGPMSPLHRLLADAVPLFQRSRAALQADRTRSDPDAVLADLSLYLRIEADDAHSRLPSLRADPRVEMAYLAPAPVPPPIDIAPTTPLFEEEQTYKMAGPDGMGFDIADRWPGARGAHVLVSDVEYGFDPEHEALNSIDIPMLGHPSDWYQFHGNGVLGIMASPPEDYGITGLISDAQFTIVSPFTAPDVYNVADAINLAASELVAGDVLLIEQQGWVSDTFTPVEIYPEIFDAIAAAVAQGIVVIEPAGNGGCDLDDPVWEGWFDREVRDSGAIIVGGGASPSSGFPPRSWFPEGSCFGHRVDVQGWFDSIVTASAADGEPQFVDLFYPDRDGRQAYTARFGGTSGAAPLVASVAAAMNSMAIQTRGTPFSPMDLRAAMVSTGHPQPDGDPYPIGPQPDLRRLMRIWGVR
jgi:serine protease